MATAIVAGFSSCSNDVEESSPVSSVNMINIGHVNVEGNMVDTRGFATTATNASSTITTLQTWGYDASTDELYLGESATTGRTASGSGSTWTYSPTQYWPVNALNFVAVAPAAYAAAGISHATASNAGVVTLTDNLTLPTDVENQVDLMYANQAGITRTTEMGNVPFTFKHALSQVVFKGRIGTSGAVTKVTIAEISLVNINKTGTITYTSSGQWFGGSNDQLYGTSSTPATFTLDASDLEASVFEVGTGEGYVSAGAAFDLTTSTNSTKKNAWMMLPQRTAAASGSYKVGDSAPASGAYLKIRAQLEKDGVVILGNAASDAFYIPLSVNWDRSKKYTYTIEFNGASSLYPITFSVASQDWTDASGINLTM